MNKQVQIFVEAVVASEIEKGEVIVRGEVLWTVVEANKELEKGFVHATLESPASGESRLSIFDNDRLLDKVVA